MKKNPYLTIFIKLLPLRIVLRIAINIFSESFLKLMNSINMALHMLCCKQLRRRRLEKTVIQAKCFFQLITILLGRLAEENLKQKKLISKSPVLYWNVVFIAIWEVYE